MGNTWFGIITPEKNFGIMLNYKLNKNEKFDMANSQMQFRLLQQKYMFQITGNNGSISSNGLDFSSITHQFWTHFKDD